MDEITNKQIADFELLAVLGDGAQGRVYKASAMQDTSSGLQKGDLVALKVVNIAGEDEQARLKFQAQADILRRLSHESIVKYIDSFIWHSGDMDECQCLVMEYLEGEDLTDRVKNMSSGLAWPQVEEIFEKCLAGLIHARECGITHRDLKPSNIYLTKDGKVKLIDFDIARRDDSEQLSTAGWKGTFDYMAPDFITQEGFHGDEISDVFSLGVCFYQALTGKLPYERLGSNAHIGYVNRWHSGSSKPPSYRFGVFRVLAGAKSFISKALSVKREQRYQNFTEMLQDFRKVHYRVVRHKGKDDYELLALLGRGGFGEVFKARCSSDGRLVAVKHLFSAKQSGRFIKEAKILQRYNHKNLVQYVDFLTQDTNTGDKQFFLVMEHLEGMPGWTLRLRIKNEGRIGVEESVKLFKAYLDALQFMHGNARPIIHRDIKPGNLYAPVGRPELGKIFDLGVARDVSGTVTVGGVPGTLDYMAPEFSEASGDRGSAQSDLYALGLCFYESLTGRPVYDRLPKDINSAWTGFITRVRNPPEINFEDPVFKDYPRLANIVRRTLSINPSERYSTANEMSGALDLALKPMDQGGAADDMFDDTVVTMATAPGGADVTLGTRPLEGNLDDYLDQIGAAKEKDKKRSKSSLVFKLVAAVLLVFVAAGATWLGVAVLMDKGKKSINNGETGSPSELPVKQIAQPNRGGMDNETTVAPVKTVAAESKSSVVEPVVEPPKAVAKSTVAEAPVVKPKPVPPPAPKVVPAENYPLATQITALIPVDFKSDKSVADANRAMLLLAESEPKIWKDVKADDKARFIEKQRSLLIQRFSDMVDEAGGDIIILSAAGKNTDAAYDRLVGLKNRAPLLIDRCTELYESSCSDADKAIKRRMVSDTVSGMTARAGRAATLKDVSALISGYVKLENTPTAEIAQAQASTFKSIAKERVLMLAGKQFDSYKSAVNSGKDADAAKIKKEFDGWSNTVTAEYGRVDVDKLALLFEETYKQAEARKQAEALKKEEARKQAEADRKKSTPVKKATIVNKSRPAKSTKVEPSTKISEKPNPPAVVAKSYLKISVSPSKAIIKIDDREVRAGTIEVKPGKNHMLEVTSPGYKAVKQFYKVEPGKTRTVDVLLQKGKSRGIFGF